MNRPSGLTVALGILAGVGGGLNVAAASFPAPWSQLITFSCVALASLGVAPLAHGELRTALHLSYPAALVIAGVLTTTAAGIVAMRMAASLKGVLIGILIAGAGILTGPDA